MTFRLAIVIHLFIPVIITIIFYNTQLLIKKEEVKTLFCQFVLLCLMEALNFYYIDNFAINFIVNIGIQLFIVYIFYLDQYKKRCQAAFVSAFIFILSFILTAIPLSFLYSIRLQTKEVFDREFTIYALMLFDMWNLCLSYYYVTEYVPVKNGAQLFKYFTLLICQFIFAFILFLLSYDLAFPLFMLVMILVLSIIVVTHIMMIKSYKNINMIFLKRFEFTRTKELENQEQALKEFKEEIGDDIENIETMLSYQLNEEAKGFVKSKYKKLKKLNVGSFCENKLIDLILYNKVIEMHDKNIEDKLDILIQENCNIEDVDLVTLLFNLIDNAIDACEEIESYKYICIKMYEKYNCLYLEVINSKDINVDQSSLKTTKEDTMNHGIGVSIIKNIVKKYKGDVVFEDHGETFRVKLFLKNR